MFGFLLKIAVVAALVVGVLGYIRVKHGSFPKIPTSLSEIQSQIKIPVKLKDIDAGVIAKNLSDALDAVVTHPGKNKGPVVLGVEITNQSLGTLVDVIQKLPPDQVKQLKDAVCKP